MGAFDGRVDEHIRDIYLVLAERSLDLAEKAGVESDRINKLRERIYTAKEKSK
jgi:hypothetical protein